MTTPGGGRKRNGSLDGRNPTGNHKETEVCLICDVIIGDSEDPDDDALYCEGNCKNGYMGSV